MKVGHEHLHGFGRTVVLPKFETSLDVLIAVLPVTLDVGLESLSEYGVEFLDVRLQANDVTVKGEHVVNTLVLETLYVYGLIFLELDQITYFMIIRDTLVLIVEAKIECINPSWFFTLTQDYHINLSQGVPCLQTHQVVERFSDQNLHVVVVTQYFNSL